MRQTASSAVERSTGSSEPVHRDELELGARDLGELGGRRHGRHRGASSGNFATLTRAPALLGRQGVDVGLQGDDICEAQAMPTRAGDAALRSFWPAFQRWTGVVETPSSWAARIGPTTFGSS